MHRLCTLLAALFALLLISVAQDNGQDPNGVSDVVQFEPTPTPGVTPLATSSTTSFMSETPPIAPTATDPDNPPPDDPEQSTTQDSDQPPETSTDPAPTSDNAAEPFPESTTPSYTVYAPPQPIHPTTSSHPLTTRIIGTSPPVIPPPRTSSSPIRRSTTLSTTTTSAWPARPPPSTGYSPDHCTCGRYMLTTPHWIGFAPEKNVTSKVECWNYCVANVDPNEVKTIQFFAIRRVGGLCQCSRHSIKQNFMDPLNQRGGWVVYGAADRSMCLPSYLAQEEEVFGEEPRVREGWEEDWAEEG